MVVGITINNFYTTSTWVAEIERAPPKAMGIEVDKVVGNVDEALLCCLCKKLLLNPKRCECGHVCCSLCFENASTRANLKIPAVCCHCDKRVSGISFEADQSLLTRLESLSIRCTLGCESVLNFTQLQKHTTMECCFREISCFNKGCGYRCSADKMDEHIPNCDYRLTRCEVCLACVSNRDMAAHQAVKRCYEQQLKRKRVLSARKLSHELKEHRVEMLLEKHLTDQTERRLLREHYTQQKIGVPSHKRAQSAGPVLTRSIQSRVGSTIVLQRYSRNLSVAATPSSCFSCEGKFLSGRRPSARRHSHSKVHRHINSHNSFHINTDVYMFCTN